MAHGQVRRIDMIARTRAEESMDADVADSVALQRDSGSPARRGSAVSRPAAAIPAKAMLGERVVVSGRGLQLPRGLPFERWLGIGRQLCAVSTSAAWCLGDWLAFGERAYAGRYRRAVELTSLDYQTLRNYAWVARRFELSRRRDALSFGHHAEVAALAEAEQDFWLRKAEEHRWPVKRLRREVSASLAERSVGPHDLDGQPDESGEDEADNAGQGVGDHGWVVVRLQLRIPADLRDNCQAAAGKASLSIEAWTVLALEHAARREMASPGVQQLRGQ